MRKLIILVALACCCSVQAAETDVTIGSGIEGKLALPKTRDMPRKVVLLLHGWNSQMNEVGNMFGELASDLADQGVASLRINFSGEGQRAGYVVTSTYDSRVGEAESALKFLKERYPGARTGVVGFSLGGLTAMGLIGRHPEAFQSVVLWSAAEQMRIAGDENYDIAVRKALKEGKASYQDFTEITLTREFVTGFVGVNTARHLKAYDGALLAVRGDLDFLPANDPQWLKISPSNDKSFLLIGGADHTFNIFDDSRPVYAPRVIAETSAWFARTL